MAHALRRGVTQVHNNLRARTRKPMLYRFETERGE